MAKININPKMLKWMRQTAHVSEDGAAKAAKIKEGFKEHEAKGGPFTLTQIRALAKAYNRPLYYFYWSEPPNDPDLLADFRVGAKKVPLGPAAIFMIREVQERQAWLKEYAMGEDWESLSFIGRFRFSKEVPPERVAEDIVKELGLSPESDLKIWRDKCYSARIFLMMSRSYSNKLSLGEEYKGFALTDEYAPFVFVNSSFSPEAQLFTLVHELAHLWINQSGMSNYEEGAQGYELLEVFCNKVAACALMPAEYFSKIPLQDYASVKEAAEKCKVSKLAAIYRAFNLKLIKKDQFDDLMQRYQQSYRAPVKGEEKTTQQGRGNFYATHTKRCGKLYAKIVWSAYEARIIRPTEAISLLGGGELGGWRKAVEKINI